jgi:hypothetical protein
MAAKVSLSVPIWLILMRMELAMPFLDAFLQDLGVGDEQVVAHQLHLLAQAVVEDASSRPSRLVHAVLDADDGVLVDPGGQDVGPLGGAQRQAFAFQVVLAVLVELAGRAVQADGDLLAGGVAGLVDGFQDELDGRFVAGHVGREAAFVAHAGGHALGRR